MASADDKELNAPVEAWSRRMMGAEALRAHVTLLVGLSLCGLAFWFELGRTEGGNELSWAYVFEWPLLAVFAVYMWWNVLDPDRKTRAKAKKKTKRLAPEFDDMLIAWQEHQRELGAEHESNDDSAARSD
jgi:hypothetical protein